jgi:sirohydrochlorin cobaltochelatase
VTGSHRLLGALMIDDYSGVLLIGHGTRDPSGNTAFMEIADHLRRLLPEMPVEGAFLEFAQPTIAEGIGRLAKHGASHIAAVPMFLSALGHTLDDIPVAIDKVRVQGSGFRLQDSGVKISIMSHVGAHQRVGELSAMRYQQALEGKKEIPAEETLLMIAAHGSPEPEAFEELTSFAASREKLTPVGQVIPCFAVLGKPQLAYVLPEAAQTSFKRIVVQPHLLLRGRFSEMIRNQVETFGRDYPNIDWIVTEPLGPDYLLAQAVVEILND